MGYRLLLNQLYLIMLHFTRTLRLSVFSVATLLIISTQKSVAQQSVARQWCEVMLNCIRNDYPRPAVQARTVAHAGWAMYDALAVYDPQARPYILGNDLGFFSSEFNGIVIPEDLQAAQEKAISYAMYRLLTARFASSSPPGAWEMNMAPEIDNLMSQLGYDTGIENLDYSDGDPAKLGNYIASQIIQLGELDGTNAQNNFANQFYNPVNGNIWPGLEGNPQCDNPNRWQPVGLQLFYDEFGQPLPTGSPAQTVEWGNAIPFALTNDDVSVRQREGLDWKIYFDPGEPPLLDIQSQTNLENPYKWGFVANIILQAKLGSALSEGIDISPQSMGGVQEAPNNILDLPFYYELAIGGPANTGYETNPATGAPYEEQSVPSYDYYRTIAEYWYNGQDEETPAGHWLRIFNEASDHPLNNRRWQGVSESLSNLEWDVKSYFVLGSGLYDAAIACWSVKGYYDYISPVSAIRYMCQLGQSSDFQLPSFHPGGIPLVPGYIEIIEPGDPLAIQNPDNTGKIKVFAWKGPPANSETQESGTGWVVGERWLPYQESDVVTPEYPSYTSEYSVLSRASAEILQRITGDEYFPGGLGSFVAVESEFLEVENGPSRDVILQWAKYKDAADQSGLSSVYGGINTPNDDIRGRQMGALSGVKTFDFANEMISVGAPHVTSVEFSDLLISDSDMGNPFSIIINYSRAMNQQVTPVIDFPLDNPVGATLISTGGSWLNSFSYRAVYETADLNVTMNNVRVRLRGALDQNNNEQVPAVSGMFQIDTENAGLTIEPSSAVVNENLAGFGTFYMTLHFDETMDLQSVPQIIFANNSGAEQTLEFNNDFSFWQDPQTYIAYFNVYDVELDFGAVSVEVSDARDINGNFSETSLSDDLIIVDTRNPVASLADSNPILSDADAANGTFALTFNFSEPMNIFIFPQVSFTGDNPLENSMTYNAGLSFWPSSTSFSAVFDVLDANEELHNIEVILNGAFDAHQNPQEYFAIANEFRVDTRNPAVVSAGINQNTIIDANIGNQELIITCVFDQEMDMDSDVVVAMSNSSQLSESLVINEAMSGWNDLLTYELHYTILDANIELSGITIEVTEAFDIAGNLLVQPFMLTDQLTVDTRSPSILSLVVNDNNLTPANEGTGNFQVTVVFDQPMDPGFIPQIFFPDEDPLNVLSVNSELSQWLSSSVYKTTFNVGDITETISEIDVECALGQDLSGNTSEFFVDVNKFSITADVSIFENSDSDFLIYPNPALQGFDAMLKGNALQSGLDVEVYNHLGQKVMSTFIFDFSSGVARLPVKLLAPGVYFIQFGQNESAAACKLVITE